MINKNIKKFVMDVEVQDSGMWAKSVDMFTKSLIDSMRDRGYVPVHDLVPSVQVSYDVERNVFNYALTIRGIYLGKRKAWRYEGVVNGTLLEKPTTHDK